MTLERGALLHKRYRIVEILGQGGMGSVYRAVDENLGLDVAVKENLFTTDEYARQFRLEAVILANLRHPNLPRVTDHFVIGDQGQYLVMDYIEGEDLRQRMERQGNINEDDAILLGAAMCDALTYLHTRKPPILHRDIKPGNVKITSEGHIFLVDFGLAKVLHGSQATTTGARAMTPGYSPPEQYGTARTDPRTDIYSLGATVYASLTGIIPEDGLARAMDNTQLTPLRKRNSKISRRLAAAIEKAMGVDPADRFQNAEEFKRALLGSKSKTQRLPGDYVIQPAPGEEGDSQRQSSIEREVQSNPSHRDGSPEEKELPVFKPRKRRRKNNMVPALLILLLLLSATIVGVVRFRPELIPSSLMSYVPSVLLVPSNTPVASVPVPTDTEVPLFAETPVDVETVIPTNTHALDPTAIAAPTQTLPPVVEVTVTPDDAVVPVATQLGGGIGQIAFASKRSGTPQIYLINADGSGLVQLTNVDGGACQPAWSPDGSQFAFISPCKQRSDFYETVYTDSSIFVMNMDGLSIQQLTKIPGSDFDPAWAPDGKRIAFTSLRDGNKQIYTVDVESLVVSRITKPDVNVENSQPVWSPQGDKIAYLVKRLGTYQVWTMTDAGLGNGQLVRSGQTLWDFSPTWSRDGKVILFNQRRDSGAGFSPPWVMSVQFDTGGNSTRTTLPIPTEDIEYSPDGLWLVAEGLDAGASNRDIYFMTITGGTRTRLTDDPAEDFDPSWRP